MHRQLDGYHSEFLRLKDVAATITEDRPGEVLQLSPEPKAWSVVQIFDHVNTAGQLLLDSMEDRIDGAQREGPFGTPPFEYGVLSRWLVRSMDPPSRWAVPSPTVFEPAPSSVLSPSTTIRDFQSVQERFAHCVKAAEGLDLRRIRLPSPALRVVCLSLGAWFEASLAHERRHLQQIRRVLKRLDLS